VTRLTERLHIKYIVNRLRERLWIKPLVICLVSIIAVFAAKIADHTILGNRLPNITEDSIETLLSVMAAGMLVIATFAVASMVSAYASATSAATPRSFPLVISDDVSQNALSAFIGAFIFSIVALTAVKNDYFGNAGRFILFTLTGTVFAIVIVTFVHWVDRIARLGRMGTTVDKVEAATAEALIRRKNAPTLRGVPVGTGEPVGRAVFAATVGYVQHVNVAALQQWAKERDGRVIVAALPGAFAMPGRPLAFVQSGSREPNSPDDESVRQAFEIAGQRRYDDDPRFGLVVLSEIAGRALSPAVNDPGTAIDIVGTLVRLFVSWNDTPHGESKPEHDRVEVPAVSVEDMFDDAFTAIGRDGAGIVEVTVRLMKGLEALASVGDLGLREASIRHARMAFARAELKMDLAGDLAAVRHAARFSQA
jgi:uncharacterized membrane protein